MRILKVVLVLGMGLMAAVSYVNAAHKPVPANTNVVRMAAPSSDDWDSPLVTLDR